MCYYFALQNVDDMKYSRFANMTFFPWWFATKPFGSNKVKTKKEEVKQWIILMSKRWRSACFKNNLEPFSAHVLSALARNTSWITMATANSFVICKRFWKVWKINRWQSTPWVFVKAVLNILNCRKWTPGKTVISLGKERGLKLFH